jgi:hypothetical protein
VPSITTHAERKRSRRLLGLLAGAFTGLLESPDALRRCLDLVEEITTSAKLGDSFKTPIDLYHGDDAVSQLAADELIEVTAKSRGQS